MSCFFFFLELDFLPLVNLHSKCFFFLKIIVSSHLISSHTIQLLFVSASFSCSVRPSVRICWRENVLTCCFYGAVEGAALLKLFIFISIIISQMLLIRFLQITDSSLSCWVSDFKPKNHSPQPKGGAISWSIVQPVNYFQYSRLWRMMSVDRMLIYLVLWMTFLLTHYANSVFLSLLSQFAALSVTLGHYWACKSLEEVQNM